MNHFAGAISLIFLSFNHVACAQIEATPSSTAAKEAYQSPIRGNPVGDTLTDFRVRGDFTVPLNSPEGWAAPLNEPATVIADQPFRLRVQVTSAPGRDQLRHYVLQFRRNEEPWQPVQPSDFPYPLYASPLASIVTFPEGPETLTTDLIPQNEFEHGEDGALVSLSPITPPAGEGEVANEWEFPLVIRLYGDGPVRLEEGDVFQFRLAHLFGDVIDHERRPRVQVKIPEGHLGGTFVETPGRIGPWQTPSGALYFIMEPTETDNRFMMMTSTDEGRTWFEVDGANRPPARDLEAVDARMINGVIHILHQEDDVWYHAFNTDATSTDPNRWTTGSQYIATPADHPLQSVALVGLGEGRQNLLAFYADGLAMAMSKREEDSTWAPVGKLSRKGPLGRVSGVQAVAVDEERGYVVYTTEAGTAELQAFALTGPIGSPVVLSDNMGTAESEIAAVLPPVFLPNDNAIVAVYREADGRLRERRFDLGNEQLSEPHHISSQTVVQNAVDSDQTGADLIAHDGRLYLIFIDASSRSLYLTSSSTAGEWSPPQALVTGIEASWIRAQILNDGRIGYVYDAGSRGGSGMNRYGVFDPADLKE